MWNFIWPMLLIIGSNVLYNIVAKGTPAHVNPFFSLIITYLVGAAIAFALFLFSNHGTMWEEAKKLNFTSYLLGVAIVGLEAGYLYLYRAGWKISVGSIVANISLAIILLAVGVLFYKEGLGVKQYIGMCLCGMGLVFINMK